MAAVAWYYCAGNSVYYWTKAYDMSATQFAIAVSERIGRTITASAYFVAKYINREIERNVNREISKQDPNYLNDITYVMNHI